jgi:putative PIN family toxin of toxin-antitoxin system
MIQVVLDANIMVSGVIGFERETSTPGAILRLFEDGLFTLITSDHLIAETERALESPSVADRISLRAAELALLILREHATKTEIAIEVRDVASHVEDDLVLAAAVSAAADFLVTGDRQLLLLGEYRGVKIVSPREFLILLGDI